MESSGKGTGATATDILGNPSYDHEQPDEYTCDVAAGDDCVSHVDIGAYEY